MTSILVKKGKFGLRGEENEINKLCHHCLPSFSKKLIGFKVFNMPWISTMVFMNNYDRIPVPKLKVNKPNENQKYCLSE